jgi:hypothetical protein
MQRFSCAVLLALTTASSPAWGGMNLLDDGSFERPKVAQESQLRIVQSGRVFHGWTVTGSGAVSLVGAGYTEEAGALHFTPREGTQSLDVSGPSNEGAVGVEQTAATTIGANYRLTFFLGNQDDSWANYPRASRIEVVINGMSQGIFRNDRIVPNDLAWKKFVIAFTASADATTIEFINRTPRRDNECGLDAVSLEAE